MNAKRSVLTCLGVAVAVALVVGGLVVALVLSIALAPRQRYTEEEANATCETGAALMRTWLAEHEPEAVLGEADNVIFSYPSGPSYLTDYVRATYAVGGIGRGIVINVVSGDVYLEDSTASLDAALPAYVCRLLDLPRDTEFVTAHASLLVPFAVEGSTHTGPRDVLDLGPMLPADVTDVVSWLADASSRIGVSLDVYAHPGDGFDLESLSFPTLNQIREREGLTFDSLYLTNEAQMLDAMYDHYYYEHYAQARMEPFLLWYRDAYREEELDRTGAQVEVGSAQVDPARDLAIVATAQGWRLSVRHGVPDFPYFLYVPSGSELLGHTYRWTQADVEQELTWEARKDGTFWLSTADGYPYRFYGSGTLAETPAQP